MMRRWHRHHAASAHMKAQRRPCPNARRWARMRVRRSRSRFGLEPDVIVNNADSPVRAICKEYDYRRGFGRRRFRSRTPAPPPSSSMNSMPPASIAARIFSAVPSRPPSSPSTDSSLAIVGSETPDRSAKSAWDHASRARAAFICRVVIRKR